MPKVGKKTYAYTPAGRKKAAAAAKRTGKPVVNRKKRNEASQRQSTGQGNSLW